MKNSHYAIIAVLLVLVGGGAFYGGMQYQKSQAPSFARGGAAGAFQRGAGAGGAAGGAGAARFQGGAGGNTSGSIVSMDDKSITLKLRDGGSKVVYFSASTTVGKIDNGTKDDLKAGDNVMVLGSANQDGSLTATMVQIRPDMAPASAPAGTAPAAPANQ